MNVFYKVSKDVCPSCHVGKLGIVREKSKNNTPIHFKCLSCGKTFCIDWTDIKDPKPIPVDPYDLMLLKNKLS